MNPTRQLICQSPLLSDWRVASSSTYTETVNGKNTEEMWHIPFYPVVRYSISNHSEWL